MRNVFDQYNQPENKLTHALVTTLERDRRLLRPFLDWLGLENIPAAKTLSICEQQLPGAALDDLDEDESTGLPDAWVYNADGWAVLFECKVQAAICSDQLKRHRKTATRHSFTSPLVIAIVVKPKDAPVPDATAVVLWTDVYCWFSSKASDSWWASEFVRYMQIFERKMLAQDYGIRGTITVFDGLKFGPDNPYTYGEGKRLILLLGDQLRARKDLHQIGVDCEGKRRPAITGRGTDQVWDFLSLKDARQARQFTAHPHLTIALNKSHATAAVTIPNGIKGGFRKKLKDAGVEGFLRLLSELEIGLRPLVKRSNGAKPMIYASQRHFKGQKSPGVTDARLEADLRTGAPGAQDGVRFQPHWLNAIFDVLVHKQSNVQFGVELRMSYACPIVRSPKATDLFAESWKAMRPLLQFAT